MFEDLDNSTNSENLANKNKVLEDIYSEAENQASLSVNVGKEKPEVLSPKISESTPIVDEAEKIAPRKKKLLVLLLILIVLLALTMGGLFFLFRVLAPEKDTGINNDYIEEQEEKVKEDLFEETGWENDIEDTREPEEIVSDAVEENLIPDGAIDSITNDEVDIDSDMDGLLDRIELELGTNLFNSDSDNDQLNDFDEVNVYNTNPLNPDSDGDTYLDGTEVQSGFNPMGTGKLLN